MGWRIRKTDKNIGIDKWQIPTELKKLLDDTLFWIEQGTFEPEEIAIRFKHRIVSIHCFPNGNGRHSRLMADIIMSKIYNLPVFSWGSGNLVEGGDDREKIHTCYPRSRQERLNSSVNLRKILMKF